MRFRFESRANQAQDYQFKVAITAVVQVRAESEGQAREVVPSSAGSPTKLNS
jgi:hypothetical protein